MGGASVSLANTCQYIPNLGQPFIHKSDECGAPRAVREKPRRREVVCEHSAGWGQCQLWRTAVTDTGPFLCVCVSEIC